MRSPRPEMKWARLFLPPGLPSDQVVNALSAMATLYGSPRIILETVGVAGQVQWWIAAPAPALRALQAQLPTYLPGTQLVADRRSRTPRLHHAAKLAIHGNAARAVNLSRSEATSRAVLNVLANTGSKERLVLQVVLGDRLRPTAPVVPTKSPAGSAERRRLLAEKTSVHGFGCTVRIGVTAAGTPRARQLIGSMLAALRGAESPRVAMRLKPERTAALDGLRSPGAGHSSCRCANWLASSAGPLVSRHSPGSRRFIHGRCRHPRRSRQPDWCSATALHLAALARWHCRSTTVFGT